MVQPKTTLVAAMYISAASAIDSRPTPAAASMSLHGVVSICPANVVEPFGVCVDERAVVAAAREHVLRDAGQQRDVSADVRLQVEAGDAAAEQHAARIARHAEIDEADLLRRIDDDDVAAAAAQRHQAAQQARMVRRRVAADQDVEVAALDVLELHRRGAGAERGVEADAARLMAIVGAVVDVVAAERPREELQQEAGLVRRAAAGVEEAAARPLACNRRRGAIERLVPAHDAVVGRARGRVERIDEPAAGLELARRQRAQLGDRVAREEVRRDAGLHVRHHRLQRLLADFREVAGLVDHAAHLAAHAERARLARVAAAHGAPQRQPAGLVGHPQRVTDRLPAAARCRRFHGFACGSRSRAADVVLEKHRPRVGVQPCRRSSSDRRGPFALISGMPAPSTTGMTATSTPSTSPARASSPNSSPPPHSHSGLPSDVSLSVRTCGTASRDERHPIAFAFGQRPRIHVDRQLRSGHLGRAGHLVRLPAHDQAAVALVHRGEVDVRIDHDPVVLAVRAGDEAVQARSHRISQLTHGQASCHR